MLIWAPTHALAQQQNTFSNLVVTGNSGAFQGTLDITRFVVRNGEIVALGVLDGTLAGVSIPTTSVALPVAITQAACEILSLRLGPLDLNLLGLMVHLDEVFLDITAQAAPGNLLGNLLCAIAHLLDTNAALNAIVALLNQLIAILG